MECDYNVIIMYMKLFKMQSKVRVRGLSQDKHAMLSCVEMDVECFGKTQHFSQAPVKLCICILCKFYGDGC